MGRIKAEFGSTSKQDKMRNKEDKELRVSNEGCWGSGLAERKLKEPGTGTQFVNLEKSVNAGKGRALTPSMSYTDIRRFRKNIQYQRLCQK